LLVLIQRVLFVYLVDKLCSDTFNKGNFLTTLLIGREMFFVGDPKTGLFILKQKLYYFEPSLQPFLLTSTHPSFNLGMDICLFRYWSVICLIVQLMSTISGLIYVDCLLMLEPIGRMTKTLHPTMYAERDDLKIV
jgi:hypothetical protein